MKIVWDINESDIKAVKALISTHNSSLVESRLERNIYKKNIQIDRDSIIRTLLHCLLISNQEPGADKNITNFFNKLPIILQYQFISKEKDIDELLSSILRENGLTRYIQKVPGFFSFNYSSLEQSNWELETKLKDSLESNPAKEEERKLADDIDQLFKGFGSKQARNFLQFLGITKYEIPIGPLMIQWMKDFEFPVNTTLPALQDKAIYHFISDGIQFLCEKAGIYPCVLEAVISSVYNSPIPAQQVVSKPQ